MYRNVHPRFELIRDDSGDEDQILVQELFRQLGWKVPAWLAPGFLGIVAGEARFKDFLSGGFLLRSIDPDGGPWWG